MFSQRFKLPLTICLVCIFLTSVASFIILVHPNQALASGTWNGQDTYHIPISWCAANGSPAQATPNITGLNTMTDTTTNAVLWRRHERPTDNIFVNTTGITFRSAINSVWTGGLSFPTITPPSPSPNPLASGKGDVYLGTQRSDFIQLFNSCGSAWQALGKGGVGIMAVNVGLFYDLNLSGYSNDVSWGGCYRTSPSACSLPIISNIVVADNHYLYPTVANRNWPAANNDPTGARHFSALSMPISDPWDIAVGHALGLALGMTERVDDTALANHQLRDNDVDGSADNIKLNATEIARLRTTAPNVPSVEVDPQGRFEAGSFVSDVHFDRLQEYDNQPPYLDLSSVRVSIDITTRQLYLDQEVAGLLPKEGEPVEFWYLMDSDDDDTTGFDAEQLLQFGFPEIALKGIDFASRISVQNGETSTNSWGLKDGDLVSLKEGFTASVLTLVMFPFSASDQDNPTVTPDATSEPSLNTTGIPVNNSVRLELADDLHNIDIGKPFRLFTFVTQPEQSIVDSLEDEPGVPGGKFTLETASFPHCYPEGDGIPGQAVGIRIEGLRPHMPIHGLFGADHVFNGRADDEGGGRIGFPIPKDAIPGYHLVTIGIDETALTADCIINVVEKAGETVTITPTTSESTATATPSGTGITGDQKFRLVSRYEDLLRRQQRLIDHLGAFIEYLIQSKTVSTNQITNLISQYQRLVARQAELLSDLESLVGQVVNN